MTMEIDAHYRGAKVQPLDPCEDCAAKDAEIERLRQDNAQLQYALEQSEAAHLTPNAEVSRDER